jgi:hypothetical protein
LGAALEQRVMQCMRVEMREQGPRRGRYVRDRASGPMKRSIASIASNAITVVNRT